MNKLITAVFVLITISGSLFAQTNKEEIELFQSVFGMEKKAIVSGFIKLEDQSKEAFWTLYDQYETERKVLGQKRISLLMDYAQNYNDLNDEKIDALMTDMIKQKASTDKLINAYYKKIKKASGSKAAAQFLQLENYLLSVIRASIFENIPFIGELEN